MCLLAARSPATCKRTLLSPARPSSQGLGGRSLLDRTTSSTGRRRREIDAFRGSDCQGRSVRRGRGARSAPAAALIK